MMDKYYRTFTEETTYHCVWCKRDLRANYRGVFVHDDVYHPDDWTPDGSDCMAEIQKSKKELEEY